MLNLQKSKTMAYSRKRNADQPAVKAAVNLLIVKNGTTTTKEVKELLQSLGYWAEQSEVSKFVSNLAISKEIEIKSDNGTYRTYGAIGTPVATAQKSNRGPKRRVFLTVISRNANSYKSTQVAKNNWVVYHSKGVSPAFIYGMNEDRTQVITHYACENGVKANDVRAKRAYNFFKQKVSPLGRR